MQGEVCGWFVAVPLTHPQPIRGIKIARYMINAYLGKTNRIRPVSALDLLFLFFVIYFISFQFRYCVM